MIPKTLRTSCGLESEFRVRRGGWVEKRDLLGAGALDNVRIGLWFSFSTFCRLPGAASRRDCVGESKS